MRLRSGEQIPPGPLDDPRYKPAHPPVDGWPPDVVRRWEPSSQIRWFSRYRRELRQATAAEWNRFWVESLQHRGLCCGRCDEDEWAGYSPVDGCCCRGVAL